MSKKEKNVVEGEPKKEEILNEGDSNKLKGISKAIYIIAKICRICVIIAIPFVILAAVACLFLLSQVKMEDNKISIGGESGISISVKDNEKIVVESGENKIGEESNAQTVAQVKELISKKSVSKLSAAAMILIVSTIITLFITAKLLKALEQVFRNINENGKPFSLENSDLLMNSGWFLLIIAIVSIVTNIIVGIITNTDISLNIETTSVFEILLMFAMAYVFKYGYCLEKK